MKLLMPLSIMISLGLTGCADVVQESSDEALPEIVTTEDAGGPKKVEKHETERPEVVTEGPVPKAVAVKTEYNFGRMALGSQSETTFEIRNEGEGVLTLMAGEATCQCTTFALSKETVEPGDSSILTVSWHAKKVDPTFQHGGPVYTSDPERQELRFVVMGKVGIDYELQPTEVWNAGEATEKTPATMKGVLFSTVNADFEIERIESKVDYISTKVTELSTSELSEVNGIAGFRIDVTVNAEFPPGEIKEPLQVYLKGRDEPIGMTVSARRSGPIRVLPTPGVIYQDENKRLSMGAFQAAAGKSVEVLLLLDKAEERLELESVEANPPVLSAELIPIGSDHKRYRLKVSVPAGVRRGIHGVTNPAMLKLKTNHPVQKTLDLNVTYRAS